MSRASFRNIPERRFIGLLLKIFQPFENISTIDWGEKYRRLSSEESAFSGKFKVSTTPWLIGVYHALDNPYIPVIVGKKSAQIGWTEMMNTHRAKRIHTMPSKMILAFPRLDAARLFYKEKWKPFYSMNIVLRKLINQNVAKEGFSFFQFPGGFLKFITAGSVNAMKSSSVPYIEVEEPDDLKEDVSGQGDALKVLIERQKTYPIHRKKLIFGGTPSDKDFSKVDAAYEQSNQMVFKVPCHECGEFHELSFENLHINTYADRRIDSTYGPKDPYTAYYTCPFCNTEWSFEQKKLNEMEAVKSGYYGWHSLNPEVKDIYGFRFNELMSTFDGSHYIELAKKQLAAEVELAKGKEGAMKSFVNNSRGEAYASGLTAMEAEELIKFRKSYVENVVPMGGLVLTAGIDVQDNRFAIIVRAWGRGGNSWLVLWKEIYGTVTNIDDPVWKTLADEVLHKEFPHAGGKSLRVYGISIDSSDNTKLVYTWVKDAWATNMNVFATKGTAKEEYNDDPVYKEPGMYLASDSNVRKTLAETMGISVYTINAHRAHTEVLEGIMLNKLPDARSNVFYFNEQSYGGYEEQIMSCKKIVLSGNRYMYKLVPGRRKEAMDGEKNALHAMYACGIHNYTSAHWSELEKMLY